jgi:dCTP diphosphatase
MAGYADGKAVLLVFVMTLESLTERIRQFRDARDWLQFHSPKDLSVAITAEAGELMQHFVWKSPEESWQIAEQKKAAIADEIADVGILLFELADNLKLNLAEEMMAKIERNESRYPAEKARGSNLKYNEL